MVRGLVEEQQVRDADAQERELQARAFATGKRLHGLQHVIAPKEEPGEVRTRRSRRHWCRRDEGIEDDPTPEGPVAQLREVAGQDVAADAHEALERGQLPGDRPQQRRLAGPVRPDQADALAASDLEPLDAGDRHGRRPCDAVAARHRLERDDDLGRAARAGAIEARDRQTQPCRVAAAPGRDRPASCSRRRSCSCIFACLRWLR